MSGSPTKSRPVRLFVSLAVSLGLHATLLSMSPGLPASPQAETRHPGSPLAVHLLPAATIAQAVTAVVEPPVADRAVIPSAQPAAPSTEPIVTPSASPATSAAPSAAPSALFPGPWYYPARYLHRRPTPLKPIWPDYPDSLEAVRGHVRILLLINEEGAVDQYRIETSEPPEAFDSAVIAAFTAARYAPALIAGYQVKSQLLAEVSFEPGAPPRADFSIMGTAGPIQLPASSLGREN